MGVNGAMPLTTFSGKLLIDHGESFLVQTTPSGVVVQTPMMMLDSPPTGANVAQLIAQATSYFVNQKGLQSGSVVVVHGIVVNIGSTPFIEVLREP